MPWAAISDDADDAGSVSVRLDVCSTYQQLIPENIFFLVVVSAQIYAHIISLCRKPSSLVAARPKFNLIRQIAVTTWKVNALDGARLIFLENATGNVINFFILFYL